jgi:hypothetical protein
MDYTYSECSSIPRTLNIWLRTSTSILIILILESQKPDSELGQVYRVRPMENLGRSSHNAPRFNVKPPKHRATTPKGFILRTDETNDETLETLFYFRPSNFDKFFESSVDALMCLRSRTVRGAMSFEDWVHATVKVGQCDGLERWVLTTYFTKVPSKPVIMD